MKVRGQSHDKFERVAQSEGAAMSQPYDPRRRIATAVAASGQYRIAPVAVRNHDAGRIKPLDGDSRRESERLALADGLVRFGSDLAEVG